jgi:hypothetical protein
MDLEMDKEVVFPPSGPYHCKQFDHSHFLLFKIIASTVAADIGKGTNTRREKGALNLKPHDWDYILQQCFLDETTRVKRVWIIKKAS